MEKMTPRDELITKRERVRDLYNFLGSSPCPEGDSNSLVSRALIISELKRLTHLDFEPRKKDDVRSPTKLFHLKIQKWFDDVERTLVKYHGDSVKEYRKRHGLSQQTLAELLGVTVTHLSKIECNERPIGGRLHSLVERDELPDS